MFARQSLLCGLVLLVGGCASVTTTATPSVNTGEIKLQGEHGYVVAYRREGAIVIRAMAPDHSSLGAPITLSHAAEESEPIVTSQGEGALVAWSERDHDGDAWRVRLVRWIPGAGASTLDEQMARSRRSAPSIAWTRDASGLDLVRVDDTSTLAFAGAQ